MDPLPDNVSERVQCPKCGARNRIPPERPASQARCGKCGALLEAHEQPVKGPEVYLFRCPECRARNRILARQAQCRSGLWQVQKASSHRRTVSWPAPRDRGCQFRRPGLEVSAAGASFCLGALVSDLQRFPPCGGRFWAGIQRAGEGRQGERGSKPGPLIQVQHSQCPSNPCF